MDFSVIRADSLPPILYELLIYDNELISSYTWLLFMQEYKESLTSDLHFQGREVGKLLNHFISEPREDGILTL